MNVKCRHTNRVACHFSVTNWSTTGCTIIHETSILRCSEIMILNHMDASIQKCHDLKRSLHTGIARVSPKTQQNFGTATAKFVFGSWEGKQTIFFFGPGNLYIEVMIFAPKILRGNNLVRVYNQLLTRSCVGQMHE